jgi:hypothetical protein
MQAFVYGEGAVPVEFGVGLVAIQFEQLRLVKGLRVGEVFPFALADDVARPGGGGADNRDVRS